MQKVAYRIIAKTLRDVGPIAVWVQNNTEENLGDVFNAALPASQAFEVARGLNEAKSATHPETEIKFEAVAVPEEVLNNLVADVRASAEDVEQEEYVKLCDLFFEGRISNSGFEMLLDCAENLCLTLRF